MSTLHPLAQSLWISSRLVGSSRTSTPCPYFRKAFTIDRPVAKAVLTATARGLYECEINGTGLGDEVFAPGWTDYNKRIQSQSHDVTSSLRSGENVLGAILGDGWYCGFVAWLNRQIYGDRPAFLAKLEVTFTDGSTLLIVTDSSWKTSTGPILESDFLHGETYDARRELSGWSSPGYDESEWSSVLTAAPEPHIEIAPRVGPPVRRLGEITPIKTTDYPALLKKLRVFDLGQNFAGRVRLRIKAPRGMTLVLRFAEVLNSDGTLYTENLRTARVTDTYITAGTGLEIWEPRFTFHGFRYVEVSAPFTDKNTIEVTGIVLHSDTPATGTFRCSNPLINQLQHNIVWGQKSNFLEVPTDCPQRDERLGWAGDAQVFIRTATFNMDVSGFFRKWFRDIRDAQGPNGGVPMVIPEAPFTVGEDGGPAWSDVAIICPWTLYIAYGDRTILEEQYDSMKHYMSYIEKHRTLDYLRSVIEVDPWGGCGDWLALDGNGQLQQGITPRDLIATAYYALDADMMMKTATVLGRSEDAEKFRTLHGNIVAAFRRRFVTPDGLVASGTQTAYVMALNFGLLDESVRPRAARELVRNIKEHGCHLTTGFLGTPYLLDALEDSGHLDVAYKLLEQETFPSWLFPVKNGATTIWERWDGWTPEKGFQDKSMNSFNHYAYGAVGAWMYRSVAGLDLDPAEPGYRHIIFRPRPGGTITWAEASLETAHGTVSIHWELAEKALHLRFTVPEGCRATFNPPAGYAATATTYSSGTHEITLPAQF